MCSESIFRPCSQDKMSTFRETHRSLFLCSFVNQLCASRFSTTYPIFSVTSLAQPLHLTHSIIWLYVEVVALITVCDINRVCLQISNPICRYTTVYVTRFANISTAIVRLEWLYSNRLSKDTVFRFTSRLVERFTRLFNKIK